MALLQVIKCDLPAHVLVWKYPKENITAGSQLVVGPSQEAVFVRSGQVCDLFGPGSYTLDTNDLPLLSALVELPFGKRTPFPAEVFFVSKLDIPDLKWGTPRHIQLLDPVCRVSIPLRAFGQYGVRVAQSDLFLRRLVSTAGVYTADDLTDSFRGIVSGRIAEALAAYLPAQNIGFLEVNAHLSEIAAGVRQSLEPFLAEYGIQLTGFTVTSVNAPEGDPSVRRLREVLDRRHEMDVLQYSYQQGRSFDVLEEAARSGGVMDLGTGSAMSGLAHAATEPAGGRCAACGAALRPDSAFCSRCGRPAGPAFCRKCGASLQPGDGFCSKCGQAIQN